MKITAISQQKRRTDRFSVYVDGAYSCSLGQDALLQSGVASGQELNAAGLAALQRLSADDKLYGNALRYAAMRPHSVWELRTYLQRKGAADEAAEAIVSRLTAAGLLDDTAFTRSWVESRRLLKPSSRRKLQQELKAKHVPDTIIANVLTDNGANEQLALQAIIERKRRQAKYADDQLLMQYLVRQGFSYDDVKAAFSSPEA